MCVYVCAYDDFHLISLFSSPQAGLAAVVGAHNVLNVSKQQQTTCLLDLAFMFCIEFSIENRKILRYKKYLRAGVVINWNEVGLGLQITQTYA